MERDAIWRLLNDVQSQIRAFDAKAEVALGIDSILAGFLGVQSLKLAGDWPSAPLTPLIFAGVLLGLYFTCLMVSFAYALRTINPQLELNQPRSRFFFSHIAERHGRDFESAARDLCDANGEKVVLDLATQVAVNSYICDIKAQRCRKALLAAALALAFYLLTLIPLSIAAFKDGTVKPPESVPPTPVHLQAPESGGKK
jgi:hypothetical protein